MTEKKLWNNNNFDVIVDYALWVAVLKKGFLKIIIEHAEGRLLQGAR